MTGTISDFTNARSSGVGSHSLRLLSNSSAVIGSPVSAKCRPAYIPIERLKRRLGSARRYSRPAASIVLFHLRTARSQSSTYSSRSTSLSALRSATSRLASFPFSSTSTE